MPRSTFNVTPGTITLTFHKPIQHNGGNDIALVSHECRETIQRDLPADMRDQAAPQPQS